MQNGPYNKGGVVVVHKVTSAKDGLRNCIVDFKYSFKEGVSAQCTLSQSI
jgi:hypothetical protein